MTPLPLRSMIAILIAVALAILSLATLIFGRNGMIFDSSALTIVGGITLGLNLIMGVILAIQTAPGTRAEDRVTTPKELITGIMLGMAFVIYHDQDFRPIHWMLMGASLAFTFELLASRVRKTHFKTRGESPLAP